MSTTYMFTDGGFLRHAIEAAADVYGIDTAASFDYAQFTKPYYRTFYYDSLPAKKDSQSQLDFERARSTMEELFRRVGSTPNVHVTTKSTAPSAKCAVPLLQAVASLLTRPG